MHGGVALWRSSRAASTRRDDARCCAPPNASRAAPSRHQPAAPDATSALSSSNRPSASQRSPRGVSHVAPKNTMKLPNSLAYFEHKSAIFYCDFSHLNHHAMIHDKLQRHYSRPTDYGIIDGRNADSSFNATATITRPQPPILICSLVELEL